MKGIFCSPKGISALSLILTMAALCWIGPLVMGPGAATDPVHAGLLPPGSRLITVELKSGEKLSAGWFSDTAEGLLLAGAQRSRVIPESLIIHRSYSRAFLGTDHFGRDLFRLMLRGGRVSLSIALSASLMALLLGMGVGLGAAVGPGWVDSMLMRGVDAMLAFPSLLLLILAASLFNPGQLTLVLLLGATSWMGLSRLVRGQAISLREREYIQAARLAASPWYRMMTWHYLPELRGPVAQDTALRVGDLVLAEATLSYLGLGLPASIPTWGRLVNEGHRFMGEAWWLSVFPGLAIALLVIAFALLGDALQGSRDP